MPRLSRHLVPLLVCLAGPAAFPAVSPAEDAPGRSGRWTRLPFSAQLRSPRAAAYDPGSQRLAIGETGGVWLHMPTGGAVRVLARGAVHDLAFGDGGVLWAATDTGLYRIPPSGAAERARLSAGASDRVVRRVAARAGGVACATDSGAFWSLRGGPFERVRVLQRGPVDAVALSDPGELVVVIEERAVRIARHAQGSLSAQRIVPGPGSRRVVDAAFRSRTDPARGPEQLLLLTENALLIGSAVDASSASAASTASPASTASMAWQRIPVTAPPGSTLERVHPAGERDYLSTDRDLLVRSHGDHSGEAWQRALAPSQRQYVARVVGAPGVWFAVGDGGVLQWQPATELPEIPEAKGARAGGQLERARSLGPGLDPPIEELRLAVLRYLDLGPGRMRKLWSGARRRGWLPSLELRGAYGGRRDQGHDLDETFTSGESRRFYDRDWGRARDFDVAALLRFELGDIAYEPESIDVSREAREVIELRDDVLDEVNQLYFERRRSLRQAAAAAEPEAAARLRDRAEELGAGLDAWSGGWFGRNRRLPSSPGSGVEKHP